MKKQSKYIIFFLIINIFFACGTTNIEENNSIDFLNIPSAKAAISQDKIEVFFDKMQLKDIQLQLKKDTILPLRKARELYQKALEESVLEFADKDKRRLNQIFNEIEQSIKKINPRILPNNIQLIKIKPHLYGEDVFYTRENAIIIPANMLAEFNKNQMKEIMIHEIFHIYSRHKIATKREKLYGLIHFEKIRKPLIVPETIKRKILLNPDGLEVGWYIESEVESKLQKLIPLLIAVENEAHSDFYFDNLELRFYTVFEEGKNLKIEEEAYYTESELTDFYDQITENTTYIIHPDEILAENFVLAVLSQDNPEVLDKKSKQGRELVENLLDLLEKND